MFNIISNNKSSFLLSFLCFFALLERSSLGQENFGDVKTYTSVATTMFGQVTINGVAAEDGDVVATSADVWEQVVMPVVLSDYSERKRDELESKTLQSLVIGFDFYHYKKNFWVHSWGNLMPYHYDDGNSYAYHKYNEGQWLDYSGGMIFGSNINKQLGMFVEGKYNKYWNKEWYDFKVGINYIIL